MWTCGAEEDEDGRGVSGTVDAGDAQRAVRAFRSSDRLPNRATSMGRGAPLDGAWLVIEIWNLRPLPRVSGTADAGDAAGAARAFRRSYRFPNRTTSKVSAAAHPSTAPGSRSKFSIHGRSPAFRGPGTHSGRRGLCIGPVGFEIGRDFEGGGSPSRPRRSRRRRGATLAPIVNISVDSRPRACRPQMLFFVRTNLSLLLARPIQL